MTRTGLGPSSGSGLSPDPNPLGTGLENYGPDAITNPYLLPGHPPYSYPCDCPLDFPHLPIGDFVGCPFIWLTHNRLDPSPGFLRHPSYQAVISLARVALLTGAHWPQLEYARASPGSLFQQALEVSTSVAAAIRHPQRSGTRWERGALKAVKTSYDYLIGQILAPVPAGPGPAVDRLREGLRLRRRDHRRLMACFILSLSRHPRAIPRDLIQEILPFVAAWGSDHRRATTLVENNLPLHRRNADPADPLSSPYSPCGPTTF